MRVSGEIRDQGPNWVRLAVSKNSFKDQRTGCQYRYNPISCTSLLPCHGRGRGFESRRPRHSFQALGMEWQAETWEQKGTVSSSCTRAPPEVISLGRIMPTTLSCACRFCGDIACTYVSSVILLVACRRDSWTTFTFSPFPFRSVP